MEWNANLKYFDRLKEFKAVSGCWPATLCGVMGKATCKWHGLGWKGIRHTDLKEWEEPGFEMDMPTLHGGSGSEQTPI